MASITCPTPRRRSLKRLSANMTRSSLPIRPCAVPQPPFWIPRSQRPGRPRATTQRAQVRPAAMLGIRRHDDHGPDGNRGVSVRPVEWQLLKSSGNGQATEMRSRQVEALSLGLVAGSYLRPVSARSCPLRRSPRVTESCRVFGAESFALGWCACMICRLVIHVDNDSIGLQNPTGQRFQTQRKICMT